MRTILFLFFVVFLFPLVNYAQIRILFDATKAESAGNADWVIDADLHNINWNPNAYTCGSCHESNPQQVPAPAQPAAGVVVPETFWDGGLSYWALDCAYKGYVVESLPPLTGRITYGDKTNPQDLTNYAAFIVCEPNILFTASEKTAMLNYVRNGGGLFMISDHTNSDRNFDGFDSPVIWNDFFSNNGTSSTNPFGLTFDISDFSGTSTKVAAVAANDTIIYGPWGSVAKLKWSGGTSITLNTAANATVKPAFYKTNGAGNTGVLVAYARYGFGKVVAVGDSSPFDDGTGDVNDVLYDGYTGDAPPNHRNLIMNATYWLVTRTPYNYEFTGNGNWSDNANWLYNIIPPVILPANDSILVNPVSGGACRLDVSQTIGPGTSFKVNAGKTFTVPGKISIK
jgi:hypothetical protein